ncbi:MAG: hypothetical protein IJL30_01755 [Clostridia bacterium]|nr:hypothetical protein [Clostridia bacterium]
MKKQIGFLLSVSLLITVMLTVLPISVFAEDIPFDAEYSSEGKTAPSVQETYIDVIGKKDGNGGDGGQEWNQQERDVIPDDRFEGEYTAFSGKNGSVTTVYDNGSVVTTYADGSREGVDYLGNRYTEDKDGKQVVYTIDGNQYIKNADGTEEAVAKNGTHTYFNTDGSYYSVTKTGTIFEYDKNDEFVAVSIEGGERLEILDKDGNLITGEHIITGPGGKKFTFVNEQFDDGSTDRFTMWSEGNGKEFGIDGRSGEEDDGFDAVMQTVDGIKVEMSDRENDGAAEYKLKLTDLNDGSFTGIRGTAKYDENSGEMEIVVENEEGEYCNINMKADSNGNSVMTFTDKDGTATFVSNDKESSLTFSDGTFIRTDPNSDAAELYIPSDGTHVKINGNGDVEIFEIPGDDGSSIRYEDGKFVVRDEHGDVVSVLQKNEATGVTTVTNADGDTYTVTKNGKVFKNGQEIIKEDNTPITVEEIEGTWNVDAEFTDAESPIVDILRSVFDEILGEGAGDGIVESDIQDTTVRHILTIENQGGTLYITLAYDDELAIYTGTFKNNTLKLKYQRGTTDDDDLSFELDTIEYKFVRSKGEVIMQGSYRIDTYLLKATYNYSGRKQ